MKTSANQLKGLAMAVLVAFHLFAFPQQAGWHWQNPYLQGNDLNSIVMNGVVGWAAGDMGTVMRTSNSGHDWEIVDLQTSENLNCIYMDVILGHGWIVGDNGTIYHTDNSGETWSKQNSGTGANLYSITAIGGECPWVCGYDVVLHSYDQGETWDKINTPVHTWFWEIDQKDCDEIWVCGNKNLVMNTRDHGATWQIHSVPTTFNLMGIDIVPNGDFRACGNQATVIRSSDGGDTWVNENQMPFMDMYAIETRGIVGPAYAVGSKGNILETLNGGNTWSLKESATLYQLNDVCFQSFSSAVYAVGWYGQVVKKEEPADAVFEVLNKKPNHFMMDMDFINADTGWVVGGEIVDDAGTKDGIILHTVNGGNTWENQHSQSVNFYSVDFIKENEGWVVGKSSASYGEGVIQHTVNGGKNWSSQSNPIVGSVDKVFFLDGNNGWIVSKDYWGQIAHTTNGGRNWISQKNPTKNPIVDVYFINPDKGWAVGMDSTILRTTNGGQNWQRVDLTVSNNWYFRSVFFVDEMHGWTVGVYGVIMLTNDGGITWQEVVKGNGETLQSVFFINPQNGWAVGDAGTVLRSVDGGYTWFNQYSGIRRNFLYSVQFTDLNNGWISGEGGTIKNTENGGFWNEPGTLIRKRLNLSINDLSETRDTLMNDISTKKSGEYQLVGLEVMIDSIIHSRAGDLQITLTHSGVTETLVSNVADPGPDFLWTRLTDKATKSIVNGIAPFSGLHKPFKPLTAFNGLDPKGQWVLSIFDSKTGHTGTLNAWGIKPIFEKKISLSGLVASEAEPKIQLFQNKPNPFSSKTKVDWKSSIDGHTTLKVFNVNGQEITSLMNRFLPKGEYYVQFDASGLNAGMYFYQLSVNGIIETKKMVLLK